MAAKRMTTMARRQYCTWPYNYCDIPLDQSYPCPATRRVPPNPQNAQGSVMSNGTRLISQDNGQATSLVGFYVDAGAMYEPKEKAGVSDFVSKMFFRSNLQSSDFHVFKTFQHAGANYWSGSVGKKLVAAKVECRRDTLPDIVSRLSEAFFIPRFAEHEMKLVREILENNAATRTHNQKKYALDLFNNTAFNGSGLANSDEVPAFNVDALSHADLINWWSTYFTPNRIIIAGINVSQEELRAAYEGSEWSTSNTASHPSHAGALPPASVEQVNAYSGGESQEFFRRTDTFVRKQFYNDVYICYGKKAAGSANLKEFAASLVAAGSIGGGVGEGYGQEGVVKAYEGVSVVGGIVRASPNAAEAAAKTLAAAVNGVGALSGSGLETAKKVAAVNFLSSVNTRDGLLDFLTLHAGSNGTGKTVPAVMEAISAVSESDLKALAKTMDSALPTYTAFGDLKAVPSLKNL